MSKIAFRFVSDFIFTPDGSNKMGSSWQLNGELRSGSTFSYCFKTAGTFTVHGNFYDQLTTCTNTIDFSVAAYPKPKADFVFTPDQPVENMEVVFTSASKGDELNKFNWFFINDKGYTSSNLNTNVPF